MSQRFLIIDDQKAYSLLLKKMIQRHWTDAELTLFEPSSSADAKDALAPHSSQIPDWQTYDVILIAYQLDQVDLGQTYLQQCQHSEVCPPVVILGSSALSLEADRLKASFGAKAYLCKSLSQRAEVIDVLTAVMQVPCESDNRDKQKLPLLERTEVTDKLSDNHNPERSSSGQADASLSYYEFEAAPDDDFPSLSDAFIESSYEISSEGQAVNGERMQQQAKPSEQGEKHVQRIEDIPFIAPPKELVVDGYDVQRKIAEGGMAAIYYCIREETGEPAVLKTISHRGASAERLRAAERSHLEFEVISRIKHPNIVRLYDHGEVNNKIYTTMELFSTGDLKQRMQIGITQQQALIYVLQIADGLNAIHGSGIIHRDLKPANIMFRDDETLAIIDFGIAKDITRQMNLTHKGMRMGTPSYMSPEQGNGGYKIDARSDLYSLGVMMYEMLTQKRPYTGPAKKVVRAHMSDPIPQFPQNFYEVQVVLDKLMGKFPHDRFESAYDLRQFIQKNYRFDATLNFNFNEKGDFLSGDINNRARF